MVEMISVTAMLRWLETHPRGKHVFFLVMLYHSVFILFTFFFWRHFDTWLLMKFLLLWLQGPGQDARIVYIDGAFDLFHAGHVEVM